MNTSRSQNLKKTKNLSPNTSGIEFGNQQAMPFKITHKDLILMAGIMVALVIAITTWMMDGQSQAESKRLFPAPKVTPGVLHKIGKTILKKF
jgi:hypothetical protein